MKKWTLLSLIFLLLFGAAGCGTNSIKSDLNQSRPEIAENEDIEVETDEVSIESNPETDCSTLNPHPLAVSMEEKFEVSYDEIMTWYCDGYAFSDILLALETEKLVDLSAPVLLSRLRTRSWELIWDELGVNPE